MKRIFVDTSGWYALANEEDTNHPVAVRWFQDNTYPLLTTNHVFSETVTLIKYRMGHREAAAFGKMLRGSGSLLLYRVTAEEEDTAWTLFEKHADKKYSFLDCTSFAVMGAMKIRDAFAFDKHFGQAGFNMVPSKG